MARSQVTAENRQIWSRTLTAECANVKVQNVCHGRKNYLCDVESSLRIFTKLCTVETQLVSGV